MFFQQLINGLTIGGLYALIAMGLTIVYGVLKIIHIAHAGVYVIGAYVGLSVFTYTHSFILALLIAMVIGSLVGIAMQKYIYLPLVKYPPTVSLIASIAMFICMEEGMRLIFGPYIKSFPKEIFKNEYHIGGIVIGQSQIIVFVISFLFIIFLWYILEKTRFGMGLKAASEDLEMVDALGIDSKKITLSALAVGSGFAAAAGMLVGLYYNSVYPSMGDVPAYKALAIIVVGGMGNTWGAFAAAIALGLVETFLTGFLSIPFPRNSLAFIFMIIVLLLKPEGIASLFKKV